MNAYGYRRVGDFCLRRVGHFFGLSVSHLPDEGLVFRFFFLTFLGQKSPTVSEVVQNI